MKTIFDIISKLEPYIGDGFAIAFIMCFPVLVIGLILVIYKLAKTICKSHE